MFSITNMKYFPTFQALILFFFFSTTKQQNTTQYQIMIAKESNQCLTQEGCSYHCYFNTHTIGFPLQTGNISQHLKLLFCFFFLDNQTAEHNTISDNDCQRIQPMPYSRRMFISLLFQHSYHLFSITNRKYFPTFEALILFFFLDNQTAEHNTISHNDCQRIQPMPYSRRMFISLLFQHSYHLFSITNRKYFPTFEALILFFFFSTTKQQNTTQYQKMIAKESNLFISLLFQH